MAAGQRKAFGALPVALVGRMPSRELRRRPLYRTAHLVHNALARAASIESRSTTMGSRLKAKLFT
jgi:hypothetical protein